MFVVGTFTTIHKLFCSHRVTFSDRITNNTYILSSIISVCQQRIVRNTSLGIKVVVTKNIQSTQTQQALLWSNFYGPPGVFYKVLFDWVSYFTVSLKHFSIQRKVWTNQKTPCKNAQIISNKVISYSQIR